MDDLTKSLEDYLETILLLEKEHGSARVTDVANRLNVKKPAVTSALKMLSDKKLVTYEPYKEVTLTNDGRKIAQSVLNRHDIITKFFTEILNLSPGIAEDDACKVEHVISEETFKRFSSFLKFVMESNANCLDITKFKNESR